jgi:hypothetical protein
MEKKDQSRAKSLRYLLLSTATSMHPTKGSVTDFKIALGRMKIEQEEESWVLKTIVNEQEIQTAFPKNKFKFYSTRVSESVESVAENNKAAAKELLTEVFLQFDLRSESDYNNIAHPEKTFTQILFFKPTIISAFALILSILSYLELISSLVLITLLQVLLLNFYNLKKEYVIFIAITYLSFGAVLFSIFMVDTSTSMWSVITAAWTLSVLIFQENNNEKVIAIIQDSTYITLLFAFTRPLNSNINSVFFSISVILVIIGWISKLPLKKEVYLHVLVIFIFILVLNLLAIFTLSPERLLFIPVAVMLSMFSVQNGSSKDLRRSCLGLSVVGV